MSQSHLFPREIQTPLLMDPYVRDRQARTTNRASQGTYGTLQNAGSVSWDMISGSGRFVAFETDASDLVADDTNGTGDIYVRDLVSNAVELVSLDSSGRQLGNRSEVPSISTDGRFVSFEESGLDGSNFRGIYVRDRQLGTTENISGASPGNLPNDSNGSAAISG